MQTFLPYPDFWQSAKCLDRARLGKQRVEVLQLLRAIREGGAWSNHPCAKMWIGYEWCLGLYGQAVCLEWRQRKYKDTCLDKITDEMQHYTAYRKPLWLGNEKFHASHRSNLLRKDPEWYGKFGWTEPNNLEYYWPTK